MNTTRDSILAISDRFIRQRGFNGFSFYDISEEIGIKTASIHYHFASKTDLGVATVKMHQQRLAQLKESCGAKSPAVRIEKFFSIYDSVKKDKGVCVVGSLATDLNTVEQPIKEELVILAGMILDWLTEILHDGRQKKIFHFQIPARTKALMIITNMLGIVQVMRLTGDQDFDAVKKAILKELKSN